MATMLKHYIDRTDLKIIGVTTVNEYNEFLSNDALKRRFEKIMIKEPTKEILYQIINKVIDNYGLECGIVFEEENIKKEILSIILNATERSHRVYDDIVNNPDLFISIIDKAFAFAKVDDSEYVTKEHFIESIKKCSRIYEPIKEKAIGQLKSLYTNKKNQQTKF